MSAKQQIETTIDQLEELLGAARLIKAGVEERSAAKIDEGLLTFKDYTEGYWHKLSIDRKTDEIEDLLAEIEEGRA